ncbi:putative outer membrane salicin receptor [Novosphingobium sp. Rr 2-17]|uniref:TonB-dependent receptor n=1 Tax=Novosphingobium sp. Rr 2-17 TaxID=555793 RepID=UPI0002699B88|nr:TonB-dependent receptor [Novosphingobium sp. Rr 2-17]EIZ79798.1 putative outer membrane salicin receptor [Novosphingobium sp. Rr 2-17]
MKQVQFLLSASLLAGAIAAQPAFAQDTTSDTAAAPSAQASADDRALGEIIVTAERRTSTAQKTAASISVRSGQDMLRLGRYDLKNILEDVPGVVGGAASNVNTSPGGGTDNPAAGLTIRGVQSNSGAGGSVTSTAAAAAIYVDDVYNGIGGNYDIDRVEVLRGPQGTLYGRSATAGVVAIHTNDPSTTTFGANLAAEIGNYDLRHFTGYANIPIVEDRLALRVSGNYYDRDGYDSAKGGAVTSTDLRAKLLWTPTDNFSALFGYAQQYNETHSGGVSISQGTSPTDFIYTQTALSPTGHNHFRQYWARFNLDLGAVAITYLPAYRTWYQNATLYARTSFFNADQTVSTPKDNFLTQELRIRNTDASSKLQWQAGFLYYKNDLSNRNDLLLLPNGPYQFQSTSDKSTLALGGFAEATYSFTPTTRLTAGGRYDHTRIRNTMEYSAYGSAFKSLTGDEGLATFNNFTYKVRLEHDLTSRNLVYATISTGFSPGDVTLTTGTDNKPEKQLLKAQTLTTYEIGTKNRFLNDRLQVNADVYYNDYGGYQTAAVNIFPDAPPPAPPTFRTINLPMRSYGVELEVQARPWANGTFTFNASYTHARYGDFGEYDSLFSSHTVPGVAPFQGTVAYDHSIPIGNASLLLRGAVRFFTGHDTSSISDSWADFGATPYTHVNSQAVGDLNATLLLNSNLSITGYVRNVTNNRFIPDDWSLAGVAEGPIVSSSRYNLNDPRTFGVILNIRY